MTDSESLYIMNCSNKSEESHFEQVDIKTSLLHQDIPWCFIMVMYVCDTLIQSKEMTLFRDEKEIDKSQSLKLLYVIRKNSFSNSCSPNSLYYHFDEINQSTIKSLLVSNCRFNFIFSLISNEIQITIQYNHIFHTTNVWL